jgi:predicted secreted protein
VKVFWRVLVSCFLFPVLYGAMGTNGCEAASPKTGTLTEKDNGTTVALSLGDRVVVCLPATAGTGYSWQFAKQKTEILLLEGKPEQEQSSEVMPGGTEIQVFRFIARHKGEIALELKSVRPWEKGVRAVKTFSVTVRVR